jgi:hypothetical protein
MSGRELTAEDILNGFTVKVESPEATIAALRARLAEAERERDEARGLFCTSASALARACSLGETLLDSAEAERECAVVMKPQTPAPEGLVRHLRAQVKRVRRRLTGRIGKVFRHPQYKDSWIGAAYQAEREMEKWEDWLEWVESVSRATTAEAELAKVRGVDNPQRPGHNSVRCPTLTVRDGTLSHGASVHHDPQHG